MILEAHKPQDLQGEFSKPETQESLWSSSSLKSGRLQTQEKPVFQFKSKDRK